MDDREKLQLIEDGLEKGLAAMTQMAEGIHRVTECLSDMTEHYVALARCGDCGHWDPEKEPEVIAARKMIAEVRGALAGVELASISAAK